MGGGTPGLLSAEQIGKLCHLINRVGVEKNCEWTVEVAPNEIDQEKITAFLEGGLIAYLWVFKPSTRNLWMNWAVIIK